MNRTNVVGATEPQSGTPNQGDESSGFWTAAAQGRLSIRHCQACDSSHHYPRAICPFCGSQDLGWRDCEGTGTIYSLSITRPKGREPFAVAYVSLPEGVTLLTRILGIADAPPKIGDTVAVVFCEQSDGRHLPFFRKHESKGRSSGGNT